MASLEDVRRYAREHADQSRGHLVKDIAHRYDMSRTEAERMLVDIDHENASGGAIDRTDGVLPAVGTVAAGGAIVAGYGAMGGAGSGAAILGVAAMDEARQERDDATAPRDDADRRDR